MTHKISLFWLILLTSISCIRETKSKPQTIGTEVSTDTLFQKDYFRIGENLMETENLNGLRIGLPYEKVIEMINQPEETSISELWEADGLYHQTIKYPKEGIELDMVQTENKHKIINMITIKAPCSFRSLKDIGIGSNYADVEKAYKDQIDPQFTNAESMVAGTYYGGIVFYLKDQKVEAIFIGASVE